VELSNTFSGKPEVRTARPSRISKVLLRAPVSLPVGVKWMNVAAGSELEHGVGVGLSDGLKLLGLELQRIRQQQGRYGKRHGHWAAPSSR
jgi:hypothetical protein